MTIASLTIVIQDLLVLWVWLINIMKMTHLSEGSENLDDFCSARVSYINAHVASKGWKKLTNLTEHLTRLWSDQQLSLNGLLKQCHLTGVVPDLVEKYELTIRLRAPC